jgi:hypothetical protein
LAVCVAWHSAQGLASHDGDGFRKLKTGGLFVDSKDHQPDRQSPKSNHCDTKPKVFFHIVEI